MTIILKRAYEPADPQDGYRVLIDRLWPRGVSKDEAKIDQWLKEIAPSEDLRKDFHSGKLNWNNFRKDYLGELKTHQDKLHAIKKRSQKQQVSLIYSAKDEEHNNAVVVEQYLKMLKSE